MSLDNMIDNYTYPFLQAGAHRDYDYLDYALLADKGIILAADWDTPVKFLKLARASLDFPPVNISQKSLGSIENAQMDFNINSLGIVAKQIYFPDADQFFEQASQRQLVFVDPTTPDGAETLFGGPPQKKKVIFVRSDIYFYGPPVYSYPLPQGICDSHTVLTVDR